MEAGEHAVTPGAEVITEAESLEDLAGLLERSIRGEIALHAPEHIFIHAGVVEVDGGAVVIPGRTFTGKTTLVRALIEAGCGYVSDEYAVVDADGWIHAYARPLSVRSSDGTRRHVPAEALGASTVTRPLRPRAVLTMPHAAGTAAALERRFSRGAVMALMNNTVAARSRSAAALAAAAAVARESVYLRGSRGEAAEAAQLVLSCVKNNMP